MRTYAFRLQPGQDLKKEIQHFVNSNNIKAGCMLSIVGSLSHTRLRLAGAKDFYDRKGKVEILSLSGTLSINGSHLHLCVADHQGKCIGGHLSDGCLINTTAELVITELAELTFLRKFDPNTGFDELEVAQQS